MPKYTIVLNIETKREVDSLEGDQLVEMLEYKAIDFFDGYAELHKKSLLTRVPDDETTFELPPQEETR